MAIKQNISLCTLIWLCCTTHVSAEKYTTWVDEKGDIQHSIKPEEKGAFVGVPDLPKEATPQGKVSSGNFPDLVNSGTESKKSKNKFDLTDINPSEFVDGDELVKSGYVKPEDDIAHYTWKDAEGNYQTTVYRRKGQQKILLNPPAEASAPMRVSSYVEVSIDDKGVLAEANPEALKVMGVEDTQTILEDFSSRCCASIETDFVSELQFDEPRLLEITKKSATHLFSTGKSSYEIIQLPVSKSHYYLRVRSFEREGVMIPSIAFLNGEFLPTRLVYDATSEYHPETWARYGFLESTFLVRPMMTDKYLLVFTQRRDLNSQTIIGQSTEISEKFIKHSGTGSFELLLSPVHQGN